MDFSHFQGIHEVKSDDNDDEDGYKSTYLPTLFRREKNGRPSNQFSVVLEKNTSISILKDGKHTKEKGKIT